MRMKINELTKKFIVLGVILLVYFLERANCDVLFKYEHTEKCINEAVEYQCTVTGSGLQALTWKVYTDNGTQFGSPQSYISNTIGGSVSIGGVFTVEQLSQSPLISNISFTVQSSINGYTIICEDGSTLNIENITINIKGIPSSPDNVTIHTDTFTNSSVNISWTESLSPCVTGYRYNISSSALEENIIMESTSNSVMVEDLDPSDDQYCVVVTAIDTGRRAGNNSDQSCFIYNVPSSASNASVSHRLSEFNGSTVHLTIIWQKGSRFHDSSDLVVPDLIGYQVSIIADFAEPDEYTLLSEILPPDNYNCTFTDIPINGNYIVMVEAINDIGSSLLFTMAIGPFVMKQTVIPTSSTPSNTCIGGICPSSTIASDRNPIVIATNIIYNETGSSIVSHKEMRWPTTSTGSYSTTTYKIVTPSNTSPLDRANIPSSAVSTNAPVSITIPVTIVITILMFVISNWIISVPLP